MKSFSIRLALKPESMSGLLALDWRRARGLSDGSRVFTDVSTLYFNIEDEAFIRLWFAAQETCPSAIIPVAWLLRSELVLHTNNECVGIAEDLSAPRVQSLFVRAKCAALEADLDRAEKHLAAAQALLNKEDETD